MLSVSGIGCNPLEAMQDDCFIQVYACFNTQEIVCALALTSKAMLSKVRRIWTEPGVQCPVHFLGPPTGEGNDGQSTQGASLVAMCSSTHCRVLACRDCFKKCARIGCRNYACKLCLGRLFSRCSGDNCPSTVHELYCMTCVQEWFFGCDSIDCKHYYHPGHDGCLQYLGKECRECGKRHCSLNLSEIDNDCHTCHTRNCLECWGAIGGCKFVIAILSRSNQRVHPPTNISLNRLPNQAFHLSYFYRERCTMS